MDRTSGRKFKKKKKKKKNKDLTDLTFKLIEVEFPIPGINIEWVTTLRDKTGSWIYMYPYGLQTRLTDRVAFIMSRINYDYGPHDFTISLFLHEDINLWSLSLLTHVDLEILGVKDVAIRKEMLIDFANKPLPFFDGLIGGLDWESYNIRSMNNITLQLQTLMDSSDSYYKELYSLCSNTSICLNHGSYCNVTMRLDSIRFSAWTIYVDMVTAKYKSQDRLLLCRVAGVAGILLVGYCLYKLARLF